MDIPESSIGMPPESVAFRTELMQLMRQHMQMSIVTSLQKSLFYD